MRYHQNYILKTRRWIQLCKLLQ